MGIEFDPSATAARVQDQVQISMLKKSMQLEGTTAMKLIDSAASVTQSVSKRPVTPTHVGNNINITV